MQEVKLEGLDQIDRLVKKLEKSPEIMAKAKRAAFEDAAPEAKRLVDSSIATSLEGNVGKVQRWQEAYVGSKGGYAAVRPKANTWTEATKKAGHRYAVGAVTNAIVSGHRFPSPSGRKYYKSRVKIAALRVPGRPFYAEVQSKIENLAKRTAEKVANDLMKHLEG